MTIDPELQDRLIRLEESALHQQHTLEQLNGVVIQANERIDELEKLARRQQATIDWFVKNFAGAEDHPDEKPPHY